MPAQVLWPERESLEDLMKLRAAIGVAAFNSEKQNNPTNPELAEWPEEYFNWPGLWFDEWPKNLAVKTLGLDPSKGADAKFGDFSAFVRLGRDAGGVLYCEADLRRINSEEIAATAVELCRTFDPDAFAIETNQFQQLLVAPIRRLAREADVELPNIVEIVNTANKDVRIRRLGGDFSQRRMRFKSRSMGTQLLVKQLREFPNADHDDGPDALEMCKRVMIQIVNGRAKKKEPRRMTT